MIPKKNYTSAAWVVSLVLIVYYLYLSIKNLYFQYLSELKKYLHFSLKFKSNDSIKLISVALSN